MNALQVRKRLLLAESDVHRARLSHEWADVSDGLDRLGERVRSFDAMAASTMALVSGLSGWATARPAPGTPVSSWLKKLVSGARLGCTLWLLFRRRGTGGEKR